MQVMTEDDRPPLARLRRIELWRLADKYGVPYEDGATKDQMLTVLAGVDFSKPPVEEPEDVPLEDMSLFGLRKECKKRGLSYAMTDKRADLLDKLK